MEELSRRGSRELGALPPAARAAVVPHRRPPAARGSARPDGGDVRRRRQAAAPGLALRRSEPAAWRAAATTTSACARSACGYFRQLDGFIEQLVHRRRPARRRCSSPPTTASPARPRSCASTPTCTRRATCSWKEVPDTDEPAGAAKTACSPSSTGRTPSPTAARRRATASTSASRAGPARRASPPEEYEALRKRLIRDLEDLKDPASGERIITEIHQREDVFPGAAMHDAPDLLLVLRDFGFVSIKNKLPVVEPRAEIAGTHHPDGVFLGYGPGISKPARSSPGATSPTSARPCSTAWACRCRPTSRARCRRRCSPPSTSMRHPVVIGAADRGASRTTTPPAWRQDEKDADHGPAPDAGLHGIAACRPRSSTASASTIVQLAAPDAGAAEDLVMVHGLATNLAFWYFHYATELRQALSASPSTTCAATAARRCRPAAIAPTTSRAISRPARSSRHPAGPLPRAQLRRRGGAQPRAMRRPGAHRQPGACRHPHLGGARRRPGAGLGLRRRHPDDPRRRRRRPRHPRSVLRLPPPHRGGAAAATGRAPVPPGARRSWSAPLVGSAAATAPRRSGCA